MTELQPLLDLLGDHYVAIAAWWLAIEKVLKLCQPRTEAFTTRARESRIRLRRPAVESLRLECALPHFED